MGIIGMAAGTIAISCIFISGAAAFGAGTVIVTLVKKMQDSFKKFT
ncbi:MAG: hypothetical protein ABI792_01790 [bacterium]